MDDSIHFGRPDEGDYFADPLRVEQTLLAAALLNPGCIDALPAGFGAHHFLGEDHGDIFDAIRMASAGGAKVILPVVQAAVPLLGGPDGYIAQLTQAVISTRPTDVKLYAETIMDAADRRALAALADDLRMSSMASAPDRLPAAALVARAMEQLDRIATGQRRGRPAKTLTEAMDEAIQAGQEAAARGSPLSGLSTGFDCIDNRLGGLEGGGVYVLGARPGRGKSALALQVGMRVARQGHPVLFLSLEMQARQFGRRALALASGVSMTAIKRGDFARDNALADALVKGRQRLAGLPFDIEDEPALTVPAINLRVRGAERRHKRVGLIIIDHAHIIGRPESAGKFGDTQALTEISMGVKRLAKDYDVPVLLLAQLNRASENEDRRPGLADLRSSGAIEQDAEAVMFIHRSEMAHAASVPVRKPRETDEGYAARCAEMQRFNRDYEGKAELIFDKVRDGERGTEILNFDAQRVRFYEEGER